MNSLAHLWNHLLMPLVDMGLMAVVFYRLLLLIRGTQAVPVAMGLVLLAAITLLLRYAIPLPTCNWLLEHFWSATVILLAIVFQPELRAALARLGSRPLGRLLMPPPSAFVDELMGAVREGMQRQMGMLIVLEQEAGLRNYPETGTIVNGELSKELLLSIFHYRSPLHDGAVIVQAGRILAAGCLLPLSNDPTMAKILGTRHRAAVGLSEFTDAWVIVVSEETGALSLAREGRLERNLSADDLTERLKGLYNTRDRLVQSQPRAVA